ncbi:MAG: hypothetical protein ACI9SC_003094 [Gammaproteobacteria bacterium]|jgi:hypothetical protein
MNVIVEIAGLILIFWLLVGVFRLLALKVEQFIDLSKKIIASRKAEQPTLVSTGLVSEESERRQSMRA